jgi:hypothetical protein
MKPHPDGWFGLACWNGLSQAQQVRLIKYGNLEIGYRPQGDCPNGAEVEITTVHDGSPGPRFYCLGCGAEYLTELANTAHGHAV